MAELTNLEAKLGEVIGLAQAGQDATRKVKSLAQKEKQRDLVETLSQISKEAAETAKRANQLAGQFKGKKSAITQKARETKQKAADMMQTYLDDDADALDGFEFLTMAEAGEVGHWAVLEALGKRAGNAGIRELAEWQLPIQRRHLQTVEQGSVSLAEEENPDDPA